MDTYEVKSILRQHKYRKVNSLVSHLSNKVSILLWIGFCRLWKLLVIFGIGYIILTVMVIMIIVANMEIQNKESCYAGRIILYEQYEYM